MSTNEQKLPRMGKILSVKGVFFVDNIKYGIISVLG